MWTQMHPDVIGVSIALTEVGDAVTLGSCILTVTDVGLYESVWKATGVMVHEREHTESDVERHEQYKFCTDQYYKQLPLM